MAGTSPAMTNVLIDIAEAKNAPNSAVFTAR
jgi:hypothetical protein